MRGVFKTLIIREIQGAIIDFRFWVVLALCVSIIPLSFYVSVKNYSQQLSDYQQEVQSYRDRTGSVSFNMTAEGVRPPSPLSIFSQGLGNKIPYKVKTARTGDYKIEYAQPDSKQDLSGNIDFAFIVSFVLSILSVVFTFSCISGDKESGVLKLIFSNPVMRRKLLMAKLIGNYIVFLAPFIVSLVMALLIVYVSGIIPIFSKELLLPVLIMFGLSLLFLLAMFNLGLWISALTRNSILSINVLLLVWIVLGLVIPKLSPIISAVIYPVESSGVIEAKKTLFRLDVEKEQHKEEADLYENLRAQIYPESSGVASGSGMGEGWTNLNNAFDEQVKPVREKYEQQITSEVERITNDYITRCNKQNNLVKRLSLLSPVNSINKLLAEFSATGNSEVEYFTQQAIQFQSFVKQEVYDRFEYKIYRTRTSTNTFAHYLGDEGTEKDIPVPVFDNYRHVSLTKVFQQNWVDIALLGFYCLLFFVCGFVSFLRFDVR